MKTHSVPRDEIFYTTKLYSPMSYEKTEAAIK